MLKHGKLARVQLELAQSPESLKLAADAQALVEQLEAMPRDDSADAVEARSAPRRASLAPSLSFR